MFSQATIVRQMGHRTVRSITAFLPSRPSHHGSTSLPRSRRGNHSIPAEAALARPQSATAALALVGATTAAAQLARERITSGEHVLRSRKGRSVRRGSGAVTFASTRRSLRAIFGIVDPEATSTEVVPVETANRVGGLGVGCELGESEPARPSGLAIGTDVDAGNLSSLGQQCGELLLGRVEAQITDEDLVRNDRLLLVWVGGGRRNLKARIPEWSSLCQAPICYSAGGSAGADTAAVGALSAVSTDARAP